MKQYQCKLCNKTLINSNKKGVEYECPNEKCSYEILQTEWRKV